MKRAFRVLLPYSLLISLLIMFMPVTPVSAQWGEVADINGSCTATYPGGQSDLPMAQPP
jgi:hypothetical protein